MAARVNQGAHMISYTQEGHKWDTNIEFSTTTFRSKLKSRAQGLTGRIIN